MLRTCLLFVFANLASLTMLGPMLGFTGPLGALWIVAVLKTSPGLYLPLLFVWVPVWLWVVAVRRAWRGSFDPEGEPNISRDFLAAAR